MITRKTVVALVDEEFLQAQGNKKTKFTTVVERKFQTYYLET